MMPKTYAQWAVLLAEMGCFLSGMIAVMIVWERWIYLGLTCVLFIATMWAFLSCMTRLDELANLSKHPMV